MPQGFLRAVAKKVKANTGLGADQLHPRLLSVLSDEALEELDGLFRLAEQQGSWPSRWRVIHVVFLAKPEGGWRPILSYCTLYRLWARARIQYVKEWAYSTGPGGRSAALLVGRPRQGLRPGHVAARHKDEVTNHLCLYRDLRH